MPEKMAQTTSAAPGHASTTSSSDLSRDNFEKPIERVETRNRIEPGWRPRDRENTVQTALDTEYEDLSKEFPELHKSRTHTLGVLKLRAEDDHDPTDWWFASTAIPLIAATFAPMANLLSIAALVEYWRASVTTTDAPTRFSSSKPYEDPHWCYDLNAASLVCGFIGNLFLLFNFTRRVRYIVALPVTIVFFYIASGILIAIIVSMNKYQPPGPNDVYTQAFWHAVIAACLYMFNSMILMVNMLGYFLGHYPQHFTLTDEQRNLILQTMLFFLWLGGGAGVFARVESKSNWGYSNALYFCDVTILTIGFGDYFATEDIGRGLVFPFSVGGTIILGLMVSSIHKFAKELSKDKVVRQHVEKRRVNTLSRAVTLEQLEDKDASSPLKDRSPQVSRPNGPETEQIQRDLDEAAQQEREKKRAINFEEPNREELENRTPTSPAAHQWFSQLQRQQSNQSTFQKSIRSLTLPITKPVSFTANSIRRVASRNQKQIIMLEERDRFNAMRSIQTQASRFKRYYALTMSIISFGLLWCLGALVFYYAEQTTQQLNYFEGLYLCYVSLLTIGYGDLSPKSSSGKAFFVLWSLIAVPTMTILVSDLGDTVIGGFKRGVLENDLGLTSAEGTSRGKLNSILRRFKRHAGYDGDQKERKKSVHVAQLEDGRQGDDIAVEDEPDVLPTKTIEELAHEKMSEPEMMRQLAYAIRRTADDLKSHPGKQYSYEDWVEFTRLIRFSKLEADKGAEAIQKLDQEEVTDGLVEWDWLDEHSPMTSEQSESEWVLDRLCESLLRIFKKSDALFTSTFMPKAAKTVNFKETTSPIMTPDSSDQVPQVQAASTGDPDEAQKPLGMGAVTKFFKGEAGYGSVPQWSKKGQAKRAAPEMSNVDPIERRRSSTSVGFKRHGPFALESPQLGATVLGRPSFEARDRRRSSVSASHRRHGPFALDSP